MKCVQTFLGCWKSRGYELGEKLKIKHHRYIDRLAAGVNRFIPAENL